MASCNWRHSRSKPAFLEWQELRLYDLLPPRPLDMFSAFALRGSFDSTHAAEAGDLLFPALDLTATSKTAGRGLSCPVFFLLPVSGETGRVLRPSCLANASTHYDLLSAHVVIHQQGASTCFSDCAHWSQLTSPTEPRLSVSPVQLQQSPLRSPHPSSSSSSSSGGMLRLSEIGSLGSLSPLMTGGSKKRVRDERPSQEPRPVSPTPPKRPSTDSPALPPVQTASHTVVVKRPSNFEDFLRTPGVAQRLSAVTSAVSSRRSLRPNPDGGDDDDETSGSQGAAAPDSLLLSLVSAVEEKEKPRPPTIPCGEIYVTDWIAQGDNMKNAVAGDSVTLRIVKRPNFKPAVQVLKKDEPFTYCWLQPVQCAMIIPLIEGGSAQIDGQWMRAASASGVRLALMLRVSLVGTQVDASKRVFAKTSTELAAWTSLAQMLRTSPAVLLSNPGIARKSQDVALLDLTSSSASSLSGHSTESEMGGSGEAPEVQQSELDKLMELNRMDVVPLEPPADITVALHHYQKEGLAWLVSREASAGEAPGQFEKRQKVAVRSDADLPAGWEMRKGPTGNVYYHNTITGVSYTQHPASRAPLSSASTSGSSGGSHSNRSTSADEVAACGGILADDM
jgi:hypothetical protein